MPPLSPAIPARSDLDWCWYLRRQGRTGDALERALHDIGVMQPGGWSDWQASTMTDTGAPVEMQFSANTTTLSLRTEVDDPGKDPAGRLEVACQQVTKLGGMAPPAPLRHIISAAQGAGELRYGAWLGLQQSDDALRTYIMAEIPQEASDLARLLVRAPAMQALSNFADSVRLSIVCYATQTDETTLYFETERDPAEIVPQIAEVANVPANPLLCDINDMVLAGQPDPRIPRTLGFSLQQHANHATPTLTLYVSAKAIYGVDEEIEKRVRSFPGDHVATYAGLADQLLPAPAGQTHHGLVGLRARHDRRPLLSIGVAAPWALCYDTP